MKKNKQDNVEGVDNNSTPLLDNNSSQVEMQMLEPNSDINNINTREADHIVENLTNAGDQDHVETVVGGSGRNGNNNGGNNHDNNAESSSDDSLSNYNEDINIFCNVDKIDRGENYEDMYRYISSSFTKVKYTNPTLKGSLNPITLNTILLPENIEFEFTSTSLNKKHLDTLSTLFLDEKIRTTIAVKLGDRELVRDLIALSIDSRNGQYRANSRNANYYTVNKATIQKLPGLSSKERIAINILLLMALDKWKLISEDVNLVSISRVDLSEIDYQVLGKEIVRSHARELVDNITIEEYKFDSERGTVAALADLFVRSINLLRQSFVNLANICNALDSVLPRIKAYVLNKIESNYQEIDDRKFVDSAIFKNLASNATLVRMALAQDLMRPTSVSYHWDRHDADLELALQNGRYVKMVDVKAVLDSVTIEKIYSGSNKLQYVIVGKNFKNSYVSSGYHQLKSGPFSSFFNYDNLTNVLQYPIKWLNSITSLDSIKMTANALQNTINDSDDVYINLIGFRDNDPMLDMLALALSKTVYVSSDGTFYFTMNANNAADLDTLIPHTLLDTSLLTTDKLLAIAVNSDVYYGVRYRDLSSGLDIENSVEYQSSSFLFTSDHRTKRKFKLTLAQNRNKASDHILDIDASLMSLYNIDSKFDTVIDKNIGASIALLTLGNCILELKKHMATTTGQDDGNDARDRIIGTYLKRLYSVCLTDVNLVSISETVKYNLSRKNKDIILSKLSNKVINEQLIVYVLFMHLVSLRVFSKKDQDILNMLISVIPDYFARERFE